MVHPIDPTLGRLKNWVCDGTDFLNRIQALANSKDPVGNSSPRQKYPTVTMEQVLEATAKQFKISSEEYRRFRSGAKGRDVAATYRAVTQSVSWLKFQSVSDLSDMEHQTPDRPPNKAFPFA
jgi:hypothetical protein